MISKMSTRVLRLGSELTGTVVSGSIDTEDFVPQAASAESQRAVKEAVEYLKNGEAVVIPTETVYGLASDARSEAAMAKIYAAKNRPADNPLIVHVSSIRMLRQFLALKSAPSWPPSYDILMQRFWPGPLSLLFNTADGTVAVRMPSHSGALRILADCGFPLAAPSANMSGRPSPTEAEHAISELNGRIPLVIDGGPCCEGLESTVLSGLESPPVVLRPGTISLETIQQIPGFEDTIVECSSDTPRAPGMKYRHYSPQAAVHVVLVSEATKEYVKKILQQIEGPIGVLWTSLPDFEAPNVFPFNAVRAGDFFKGLRYLDSLNVAVIVVQGLPNKGVGRAFMNRALKAASVVIN